LSQVTTSLISLWLKEPSLGILPLEISDSIWLACDWTSLWVVKLWHWLQLVAKKLLPKLTQVSGVHAEAAQAPLLHDCPLAQALVVHAVQPLDCVSQVSTSDVPEHWVAPAVQASVQVATQAPLLHAFPVPQDELTQA
jgi:hypothetical protein